MTSKITTHSAAEHRAICCAFTGKADFLIDLDRRSIQCAPRPAATSATIRHLLLDQVVPLLLSRETRLVLHASAVATPRGAIAFVGFTGSGKSTLAAAVAARGFPLLCDDCLVVEPSPRGVHASPFYPGARLYPDSVKALGMTGATSSTVASYTRKRRIAMPPAPHVDRSTPLACVFVLDRHSRRSGSSPGAIAFTRLRPRDALMALLACTFHLDVGDAAEVRRGFDLQYRLVERVPSWAA